MDSEYNGDVPELANHITQRVADKDTNILFHNKHFIKKNSLDGSEYCLLYLQLRIKGRGEGELEGFALGNLTGGGGGKFATRAVLVFDILQ